jgi:hypothetical protein
MASGRRLVGPSPTLLPEAQLRSRPSSMREFGKDVL